MKSIEQISKEVGTLLDKEVRHNDDRAVLFICAAPDNICTYYTGQKEAMFSMMLDVLTDNEPLLEMMTAAVAASHEFLAQKATMVKSKGDC